MTNLSTKCEVSIFTHYKDTKCSAKSINWGGFGQSGVTQGHWQSNHSIEHIRLPFWL